MSYHNNDNTNKKIMSHYVMFTNYLKTLQKKIKFIYNTFENMYNLPLFLP